VLEKKSRAGNWDEAWRDNGIWSENGRDGGISEPGTGPSYMLQANTYNIALQKFEYKGAYKL
jgi:hypothetical protein